MGVIQPIVTANIGRGKTDQFRRREIERVREAFPTNGPIIGWQEIDEADGRRDGIKGDEHNALKELMPAYKYAKFGTAVPIGVPHDWKIVAQGDILGHKGEAYITPHRPIVWARLRHKTGIEYFHFNSHVVAGAWTNPGQAKEKLRRALWSQWFDRLRSSVISRHRQGFTCVVTCDANHPYMPRIHANEKRFVHHGIDYIIGVEGKNGPRLKETWDRTIDLRIDGHNAQAVHLEFIPRQ